MRKFTKSILALAMLCVAGTASAQDVETDLTADMFKTWNGYGANAVATGDATVDFNIGNDVTIKAGGMVCGTGTVDYLTYADISGSSKIVITGDAGLQLRVLMNRQESNSGPLVEKNPTIGDGGSVELDLTELTYVHINAIKLGWSSPSGKISSIKFVKPSDPYEVPKAALKAVIDKAKLYNQFAKTTASWSALQNAITDAETEYANPTSTDALTDAATAIENAIAGLKLQAGYANLTADMFMTHASTDAGAAVTAKAGCAYELCKNSSMPYGDSSVGEKNWADLTPYENLILLTVSGDPRFCMNRLEANGQQAATQEDSKMLDINDNAGNTWSATKYQTIDGSKYTLNLAEIVKDYGFARVHSIKQRNGQTLNVTDMLIYAAKSKVVVDAAGYATFSSIMNVDMTGVTAYAAKVNDGKVVLTSVTEVPANNAVIIEAAAGTYNLTNIESAAAIADNELMISNGTVAGDGTIYVLANKNSVTGFYKLATGQKVPAGKAYLKVTSQSAPEFLPFEGGVTGIETVKAAKANNEIFNLAGQRVAKTAKGLYIVNGKKVVVK